MMNSAQDWQSQPSKMGPDRPGSVRFQKTARFLYVLACIWCTYIHTYIHSYIHTYTHTYIHTYIHLSIFYIHIYLYTYLLYIYVLIPISTTLYIYATMQCNVNAQCDAMQNYVTLRLQYVLFIILLALALSRISSQIIALPIGLATANPFALQEI